MTAITSIGPISTVITENRGSNVRILADTIQLQTWGMNANSAGGLTAYNPTSNVAAMTISGSNISIFGDVRVAGEFYDGYGGLRTFGAAVNWATCNIAAPLAFPTGAAFAYSGSNGTYRYSGNEIVYNVRIDGRLTSAASTATDDFELVLPFPVKDAFYLPGTGIGDLRLNVIAGTGGTTSNAFQVCARTVPTNGGRATLKVLSGTAEVPMGGLAANSVLSLTGSLTYATSVNSTGFTSVFKDAFQDTSTGNIGFGTRAPRSTLHVNGDIMFTGALRDADSNAIWTGINVQWYPTQTPPVLTVPAGAAFTTSAVSGTYRYVGNDITYNASISGTLTAAATTQTNDFTLSVPYPVKTAGYATNTIVGDFWLTVATTAYTNTYTAYARTLSTNPNVVVVRYLSGTSDDSLAKFPAGATMSLQGTMTYQTTLVNNGIPLPTTYIPANLYQDQLGNVMIKGSNVTPYLPRGQLDVIGSNVDAGFAGLVVDQLGSGKVAVFKNNAVDKVTIDENGRLGIGTVSPKNQVHVSSRSGIRIDDGSSNIFLLRQLNNSLFGGEYSHITPFNATTNTIQQLVVDGTPVLINPLSGNVGIGTTNPQAKLHVSGDISCIGRSIWSTPSSIKTNFVKELGTLLTGGTGTITLTFPVNSGYMISGTVNLTTRAYGDLKDAGSSLWAVNAGVLNGAVGNFSQSKIYGIGSGTNTKITLSISFSNPNTIITITNTSSAGETAIWGGIPVWTFSDLNIVGNMPSIS